MSRVDLILLAAGIMLAVGLLTILSWLLYTVYLDRVERRLATRKGLYRDLVSQLATRDRALLEPTIHQMSTLYDLDALEAVLEEQARGATGRPAWLLEVYDQLGLVDKYIDKLRRARKWRDRAFAAELLGRVGSAKAVPPLLETVQATQTEDADVREIALRALARIADPAAVGPLVTALANAEPWLAPRIADILARHGDAVVDPLLALLDQSSDHTARAWAANVLGEVGARRAVPALIRSLDDPDDEVRGKSATALGRLGDRRSLQPLLGHLLTDPAPFVRVRIASTLSQFGEPEVIDRLVRSLGDSAWWVRMRGVEALEQIGPLAEGPLLVALGDPNPEIRQRAAVSLERLGVPARLLQSIEQNDGADQAAATLIRLAGAGTRELLVELLLHPSPVVRENVISAIREAERADLGPELAQIAAGDADPRLRTLAFDALRELRANTSLPAAIQGMADPDPAVRVAAIRLIGASGNRSVLEVLRSHISDPNGAIRAASISALGALGGGSAQPDFITLLQDPEAEVRAAAARATGEARLQALVPEVSRLLSDPDRSVRIAASRALGALGDRSAVPALLAAWQQAESDLKESLTLAVSRLDMSSLSELIDRLTTNEDAASRLALARALGRFPRLNGLEHLVRLAGDSDPEVRCAAIQALARCARANSPGEGSVARIIGAALQDPVDQVRAAAIDACARLGLDEHTRTLISILQEDPAALVRERAALAIGLLRSPGGEAALRATCRSAEPVRIRAAAALAAGAYDRNSMVTLVLEMPDETSVRELLRDRLRNDPWFRLLSRRLPRTSDVELRALASASPAASQTSLADGLRGVLDPSERVRLISGLRTFQGEHSRSALLQLVRGDPSAEVRTAALTSIAELLDPDELLSFGSRALGDPSAMVRRAAVGLFTRVPPQRAFPRLILALKPEEEVAVLTAVAGLVEEHFAEFRETVLAAPLETQRAVLVARLARQVHHPDLSALLSALSRSAAPEIREAVAEVWGDRPDAADSLALETMLGDPVLSVRRIAIGAAVATERYELLDRMTQDPEADVRREIAVRLGKGPPIARAGLLVLEHLETDPDMTVRASAYVARLLQGVPVPLPPDLDTRVAAEAIRAEAELGNLRHVARTAAEERRLSAALALALIQDDVAYEVARTDPAPAVRHRVAGALELSLPNTRGELA